MQTRVMTANPAARPADAGACPQCEGPLARNSDWPVWCPACDWNLTASVAAQTPPGRFARAARELGLRLGTRLFTELARQPIAAHPHRDVRGSASLILAHGLAALVHLSSLLLIAVAALLWLRPWTNLFVLIAALALPLLAWSVRPRVAPPPEELLRREDFPTLHTLADRTAQAMGAQPADGLAVSTELNASFRRAGWRGRRYVTLGLPLLLLMRPDERAAIVAHELAHGVNGDPLRGHFLYSAVDTVFTWSTVIRPAAIGASGREQPFGPFISLLAIPIDLAMLAASQAFGLFGKGMLLLVYRESQRAEYLADRLAASVTGPGAMRSALRTLSLSEPAEEMLHRAALNGGLTQLGALLREFRRDLPELELERLNRLSRREDWRVDATHPPTALRIDMLARFPEHGSPPLLNDGEETLLEAELARLTPNVQRELTNHYVVGLHG